MRKKKASPSWCSGKRDLVLQMVKYKHAYFQYLYAFDGYEQVASEDGATSEPRYKKVGLLLAVKDEVNGGITCGYSLVHFRKKDFFHPDTAFSVALARCAANKTGELPVINKGTKKDSAIDIYNMVKDKFTERAFTKLV